MRAGKDARRRTGRTPRSSEDSWRLRWAGSMRYASRPSRCRSGRCTSAHDTRTCKLKLITRPTRVVCVQIKNAAAVFAVDPCAQHRGRPGPCALVLRSQLGGVGSFFSLSFRALLCLQAPCFLLGCAVHSCHVLGQHGHDPSPHGRVKDDALGTMKVGLHAHT